MKTLQRLVSGLVPALAAALLMGGCLSTHALRDFTTDSCSFFPEGDQDTPQLWSGCCVTHDAAYWRGGTAEERRSADVALRECVLALTGRQALADRMYRGVRASGAPFLPTTFRWGYGWGYGRGYEPLSAAECRDADDRLAAYRRATPTVTGVPAP